MHFLLIQKTWRTVAHHVASRIRPTSVRLCMCPDESLPTGWDYADCAADMSVPALSVAHPASRRDLGAEIVHIRWPHGQISAALPLGVSDEFAGNDA
jgi:hypothetical protein